MSGLVDTHCHIHAAKSGRADFTAKKWHEAGETAPKKLLESAQAGGVQKIVCVGTDLEDSRDAVEFVQGHDNTWASIGVHPHEAKTYLSAHENLNPLEQLADRPKVVAVGEVGLDYYYEHSPRKEQIRLLEMFLQFAADRSLPIIFHIREAFDDFWPVFDNFKGLEGVMHSFTADTDEMDKGLSRGLFIGLNGIMTFTKEPGQLEMAKAVPLNRLVLETDSPYLAPKPYRGRVCRPEYIKSTAEFLAELRGENYEKLSTSTSQNAGLLFKLR
jgi:TatD DNase family protein